MIYGRVKTFSECPFIPFKRENALGDVLALLVDNSQSTVAALTIGSKLTQSGRTLPYQSIRLVGVDIVLLDSEARLEEALPLDAARELERRTAGTPHHHAERSTAGNGHGSAGSHDERSDRSLSDEAGVRNDEPSGRLDAGPRR